VKEPEYEIKIIELTFAKNQHSQKQLVPSATHSIEYETQKAGDLMCYYKTIISKIFTVGTKIVVKY
jgi:hypothetical protein